MLRAEGHSGRIAVPGADRKRFKTVNDVFGHAAGDRLLVAISARLSELIRPGDTLARIGGDEFVILCEGLRSRDDAAEIAERIVAGFPEPLLVGTNDQAALTA